MSFATYDKTKGLVSGGNKGKLSSREYKWWQGGELGLGVDPAGVSLHDGLELRSCELSV